MTARGIHRKRGLQYVDVVPVASILAGGHKAHYLAQLPRPLVVDTRVAADEKVGVGSGLQTLSAMSLG